MRGSLEVVAKALVSHRRLLITWHVDPDPDSVGSGLALQRMLKLMGKDATCISPDPLGQWFDFLPGVDSCETFSHGLALDYSAAVVIDAQMDRCGGLSPLLQSGRLPVINIDHHRTNPGQGVAYWVDTKAAATGELIYRLAKYWQLTLDTAIATNLFAAISADTGTFRYSNTKAATLRIASELVTCGADPANIAIHLYEKRSRQEVELMALALDTLELSPDGSAAWITITQDMLQGQPWGGQHSDDVIQFPRMIDTVEVAMLFREMEPEKTKVSFRSRDYMDVSYIAGLFGGGGHARAAGCTLDMSLAKALTEVIGIVIRELEGSRPSRKEGNLASLQVPGSEP
ncbi:MAG: bifunctional oligoribonuclease/PAP phosphatase NrnA [Firmicutes bacterium]|nr:bifunctional oligoribonuclease/PAP phosphatase NrnA [Bacillota bacterium]